MRVAPVLLAALISLCRVRVSTGAVHKNTTLKIKAGDEIWRKVGPLVLPQKLLQRMRDTEMNCSLKKSTRPHSSSAGPDRGGVGGRITSGEEAKPHQFPYQAGLLILMKNGKNVSLCGGSLLTPSWVLTAAHCAEPAKRILVITGAHNILEDEPHQQKFVVDAGDVVVHPGWNPHPTNLDNDIALIHLPNDAQLNDYVGIVRIPSLSRAAANLDGKSATMSGWGKTSDYDDQQPFAPAGLQFVTTRIVPNEFCFYSFFCQAIKDSNICASGAKGKSVCLGDSGGPLTINDDDGQETLVGIASFVFSLGCTRSLPSAFTRVTSYLAWIANVTGGGYQDTEALGPIQKPHNPLSPKPISYKEFNLRA